VWNNAFPLHVACRHARTKDAIMKLINLYPEALKHPNCDGSYPWHILIEAYLTYDNDGFLDILALMIENDPNCLQQASSSGCYPLHVACCMNLERRNDSVCMTLIEAYLAAAAIKLVTIHSI
jgi:hypothetical protein